MTNKDLKPVPTMFQLIDTVEERDKRFLKVKIWLMHLGENYNGSYFTKEAVTKALPTLNYTPIQAYVTHDEEGNLDFAGHMVEEVVDKEGNSSFKYHTQAIGVIPKENNAKFESRVGEDGIEREYLTVEGLIWAKWQDPVKILRQYNIKGQSMELSTEYKGTKNEEGYLVFEEFSFTGACILGEDVEPAMIGSTIEVIEEEDKVKEIIFQKLQEFKTITNKKLKGEKEMPAVNKKEEDKKTQQEQETADTEQTKKEQDKEKEVQDETKTKEKEVENTEDTSEKEQTPEDKEEDTTEKENTSDDKDEGAQEGTEETADNTDTTESGTDNTAETNFQTIGQLELELSNAYKTIQQLEENLYKATEELVELREYKDLRLENDLKAKFLGQIPEERINEIFQENRFLTLEEIEDKIYAEIGRLNFSRPKKKGSSQVKLQVSHNRESVKEDAYGGLFDKY